MLWFSVWSSGRQCSVTCPTVWWGFRYTQDRSLWRKGVTVTKPPCSILYAAYSPSNWLLRCKDYRNLLLMVTTPLTVSGHSRVYYKCQLFCLSTWTMLQCENITSITVIDKLYNIGQFNVCQLTYFHSQGGFHALSLFSMCQQLVDRWHWILDMGQDSL